MSAQPARPRVLMNCATSLDGKLNPSPRLGATDFVMSRFPEDHRRMKHLRGLVDAVVLGATSVRHDDPDFALDDDEHARRKGAGIAGPLRVVITRRGDGVTGDRRMFEPARGGEAIVAHPASLSKEARARIGAFATLAEVGADGVDVGRLLEWLAKERGVARVLCEGGGDINALFFAARAVDELYLTLCPRVLGGTSAPTLVAGPGFALDGSDALPDATLGSLERVGDELFLRYDFRWRTRYTASP